MRVAGSRADAIVVAAGASTRMGGTDKLLATIGDRPLLAHAIDALATSPAIGSIVVVTTTERRRALEEGAWVAGAGDDRITFVTGGERRQDSVRAGFLALESAAPDPAGTRVVLVHDGARPFVPSALVDAVMAATERYGAAIPVQPVSETLKRVVDDRVGATVDRSGLATAQTPQGVRRSLLREALASDVAADGTWTDEAALLEACRIPVHVVPGEPANLKVTVPADLDRAATLLGSTPSRTRSGIGHDRHPFGPGEPLRLGGIELSGAPRLYGHSDGDVALHAVADALLGAAGLGDLGRMFPAGPSTPAGVPSSDLLSAVVERLAEAGWRPVTVDLTIVAARPRLVAHLDPMRDALATQLRIGRDRVNVKASTGNLGGEDGAGRSISALALATIEAAT
jgi:2-C-methyl-D-erythritol 4-phosphate cytidylyltransferase / 2-C-methyl-D-erythritol 2,4-cyclodiphosphate synthase